MVAMAALQVFIVKMFFTGGRKGEHHRGVSNCTGELTARSLQATYDPVDFIWCKADESVLRGSRPPHAPPSPL